MEVDDGLPVIEALEIIGDVVGFSTEVDVLRLREVRDFAIVVQSMGIAARGFPAAPWPSTRTKPEFTIGVALLPSQ